MAWLASRLSSTHRARAVRAARFGAARRRLPDRFLDAQRGRRKRFAPDARGRGRHRGLLHHPGRRRRHTRPAGSPAWHRDAAPGRRLGLQRRLDARRTPACAQVKVMAVDHWCERGLIELAVPRQGSSPPPAPPLIACSSRRTDAVSCHCRSLTALDSQACACHTCHRICCKQDRGILSDRPAWPWSPTARCGTWR